MTYASASFRIDNKIARKVFNGDFDFLPLSLVNTQLDIWLRKEELQENYSRSKYIKKSDFNGLVRMEIIVKKIENFERNEHIFNSFIMEKSCYNNGWYIRGKQYCNSWLASGTNFTFTDETLDDIIDRELDENGYF